MKKTISKLFLDHPASVGESYFQHLLMASAFSIRMMIGGIASFLHGIFPFLCIKTGSGIIIDLHDQMVANRSKQQRDDS